MRATLLRVGRVARSAPAGRDRSVSLAAGRWPGHRAPPMGLCARVHSGPGCLLATADARFAFGYRMHCLGVVVGGNLEQLWSREGAAGRRQGRFSNKERVRSCPPPKLLFAVTATRGSRHYGTRQRHLGCRPAAGRPLAASALCFWKRCMDGPQRSAARWSRWPGHTHGPQRLHRQVRDRGVAHWHGVHGAVGCTVACARHGHGRRGMACTLQLALTRPGGSCTQQLSARTPRANVGAAPANGVRGRRRVSRRQHAALVGPKREPGRPEGSCFVSIRRRVGRCGSARARGTHGRADRSLGKSWKRRQAASQVAA